MPELPEVETIITNLRQGDETTPSIIGRQIITAEVKWEKTVFGLEASDFVTEIQGKQLLAALRRGKFLHFLLDKGHLLVHLRMSGDMFLRSDSATNSEKQPDERYDRAVFHLDNDWRLVFNDTRKFGRIWLTEDPNSILGLLGPEPFDPKLTDELFYEMLQSRGRMIKPLLMDQTFLAGLGNIYTDEALFLSKIHPLQVSNCIGSERAARLLASIREVLQEGIRRNGASIDWVYRGGDFQNYFNVYQRTGQACPRCGMPIQKTVIGQRGTHYCAACQVLEEIPIKQ